MKKISFIINFALILSLLLMIYYFAVSCWQASFYFSEGGKVPESNGSIDATPYMSLAIEGTIFAVIEAIVSISLGISLFLFNYRFDGVSMREKVAKRLAESAEKRKNTHAEREEARKQKRLEKLQAEMDELKKE